MDENIWPYQIKRNSRWRRASKIRSCRNAWRARQGRLEAATSAPATPSAPDSSLSVVGVGERRLGSRVEGASGLDVPKPRMRMQPAIAHAAGQRPARAYSKEE